MAEVMEVKDVCAYLKISSWKVRDLTRTGGLPFVQLGRRILFDKANVDEWLESQKIGVKREGESPEGDAYPRIAK